MVYLYDACDQISDFCHQQLLRKMRQKYLGRTDGQTDRGKTVYPPPPSGSGGIQMNSKSVDREDFKCQKDRGKKTSLFKMFGCQFFLRRLFPD